MERSGDKYIFVGGVPRSGTSMFQKIMDNHSCVYAGPEFDHLTSIANLYSAFMGGISNGRQLVYYEEGDVKNAFKELIGSFLDLKKDKEQMDFISEKSPSNILVFKVLVNLFPSAKFVWVVRDPRASMNSFRKVYERSKKKNIKDDNFGRSFLDSIDLMLLYFREGAAFCEQYPDQCYTIYYEDIVNNPSEEIQKVCNFINITYEESMLDTSVSNETSKLLADNNDNNYYTSKMYDRKIDLGEVSKWKAELPEHLSLLTAYYLNEANINVLERYSLPKIKKSQQVFLLMKEYGMLFVIRKMINKLMLHKK